jgi:hypothetical protein
MFAGVLRFVPLARIKSPVRLPFFLLGIKTGTVLHQYPYGHQ